MSRLVLLLLLGSGLLLLGPVGPSHAQETEPPSHAVGLMPVTSVSDDVKQAALASVHGPDGTGKDGPMAKVGAELSLLYEQFQGEGQAGVRSIREDARQPVVKRENGEARRGRSRVRSPISADGQSVSVNAIAAERPSRLLGALQQLGLEGGATAGGVVSGRLPISAIQEAAQLKSLQGMLPSYARTHVGRVESEADTSHSVYEARLNTGLTGDGQKICAMSDSYNQNDSAIISASDDVESGDLPGNGNPEGNTARVDVVQEFEGDGRDEGRAMLQLIHDIVPGARLGFHTAFGGIGIFAQGIQDLADAGCTVIVDDVGYNVEPFYQDGPVSTAANSVARQEGIPYFSSAGNDGQNSYEAPFRNSGESGVISSTSVAHDFDPAALDTDTRQEITVNAGGTFRIFSFQWTDPSEVVEGSAGPDTDIDIALVNENRRIEARSERDNISSGVPVESLEYTNETESSQTLNLVIEKAAGPDPDEVKYVYSGGGYTIEEYDTLGPTVYGHPMAEDAMAVAAAPFYNTNAYNSNSDPASLEAFSSKGGIPLLFDQDGNRVSPVVRAKPDVTGTDGTDNTFFGSDISDSFFNGVDADPYPNFFGTSAAAPNVAAIAGLIRQARPSWTAAQVYDRLESTAADVTSRQNRNRNFVSTASGRDPWSGAGFVQAIPALPSVDLLITSFTSSAEVSSSNAGTATIQWRQIGGEEDVQAFVLEQRFFDGRYQERTRIESTGPGKYEATVEDLRVGEHTFQVSYVNSEGEAVPAGSAPPVTVQAQSVDVAVYPNPFQEQARVSFALPEQQPVTVEVYDVLGRRVATLLDEEQRPADDSRPVVFNASQLRSVGTGVYFFRVKGDDFVRTVKAVRIQ